MNDEAGHDQRKRVVGAFETLDDGELAVGAAVHQKIGLGVASGSPAPTYQWQISTDTGTSWNNVSGGSGVVIILVG